MTHFLLDTALLHVFVILAENSVKTAQSDYFKGNIFKSNDYFPIRCAASTYDIMTGEGTYTPTCHGKRISSNNNISQFTCHPVISPVIPRASTMTGN